MTLTLVAGFALPAAAHASRPIELLSVTPAGIGGDQGSLKTALTDDGRYVAFGSEADDLVVGDTNGSFDVFLRDRVDGTTALLSRNPAGTPADGGSGSPDISADGRFVVFGSSASDLTSGDTNGHTDIFRLDRDTGSIAMVSVAVDGGPANDGSQIASVSDDGRYVAFESFADNLTTDVPHGWDVYVRDMKAGVTTLVSRAVDGGPAASYSERATISGDGRFVAFQSGAPNLVANDTNGKYDVFLFDRAHRELSAISRSPEDGATANGYSAEPSLSADGQLVAYQSGSTDLVPANNSAPVDQYFNVNIYLYNAATGTTIAITRQPNSSAASISDDGHYITYETYKSSDHGAAQETDQTNVYRYDSTTRKTLQITRSVESGNSYNAFDSHVSSSGYIVFESENDITTDETPSYRDVYGRQTRHR